jgi:hypothetical protein
MYNNDPLVDQLKIRLDVFKQYGKDNPQEYINPQVNQMIQAFKAFPELVQMVQQYVQAKQAGTQQGGSGEQPGMAA